MGNYRKTKMKTSNAAHSRKVTLLGTNAILECSDLSTKEGKAEYLDALESRYKVQDTHPSGRKRRVEANYSKLLKSTAAGALADLLRALMQCERRENGEEVGDNDGTLGEAYGKIGEIVFQKKNGEPMDFRDAGDKLRKHMKNVLPDIQNGRSDHFIEYDRVLRTGVLAPKLNEHTLDPFNVDSLTQEEVIRRAKIIGAI